jgi:SET domain-containing protein
MSDYEKMLTDIGMTQEFFDKVIEMCDKIGIIKPQTDMYYKGESEIQGVGIFARKNIKEGDVIGLASVDRINKTLLSRYTNHSDNKNAMFYYLANDDQIMIATKDINKNEEIVVDYRDNLLNSLSKMMLKIQDYEKCI